MPSQRLDQQCPGKRQKRRDNKPSSGLGCCLGSSCLQARVVHNKLKLITFLQYFDSQYLNTNAKFSVNFRDMENQEKVDFTRMTVAGAYDYPISKRTALYTLVGYSQEKVEKGAVEATPDGYQAAFGIIHKF